MAAVKIAENKVWVSDVTVPLLSGEVHYWRVDPNTWRSILHRVQEMGLNVVATYVCWDFHEVAPGKYDFCGETDPRRNVRGFLDLLTEMGFWIILRPGPYIYSEWNNNGVPDHATKYHRLDPAYLKLAEHYMEAVVEATQSYLATRGGRILLWQADNEIDPWTHLYTEQWGLAQKMGIFHDFLREKYTDLAALNAAWRTSYTSFDEARAVSEMFPTDPALMSRYNDFRAFIHWCVNRISAWAVNTYRNLNIDVPILLNTYSGVGTQVWAEMEKIADVVGPDIYPSREFLYRTGEHRHILEALRYASSFSRLPYIPEYEAGIWHDWLEEVGTLTPNHYRLICLTALQGGAVGWNWYMLVNRDNWYQSPINEWGNTRPQLFNAFCQITHIFHDLDPTTLIRQTHTAVTFDPLQRSTERPGQELLSSFHNADIDYDFFDLTQAKISDKKTVFYAGGSWLSAASQQKLVEYVENGGHLVCLGAYPKLDEHLQPLNLLEIAEPAGIVSGAPTKMHLALFDEFTVESQWVYLYEDVPGKPIIANRLSVRQPPSEELLLQFDLQTGAHYTIGYTVHRGRGQITMLGMQPSPELLLALHQHFEIPIPSRSRTADVTSAFFQRDQDGYVIATNTGNESKSAEIMLSANLTGRWQMHNLLTGQGAQLDLTSGGSFHLAVPRKDGTIVRLSPA